MDANMSIRLMQDKDEIRKSVELMENTFLSQGNFLRTAIAFRPERVNADVIWNPYAKIWSLFWREPPNGGNRYWICHGLEDPNITNVLRIGVETNVPHQGINKRLGGAFVREEIETISLLHTGRLGGGSNNQKYKQRMLNEWLQDWQRWWVPDLAKEMIFLGRVGDQSITKNIATYADLIMQARKLEA